MSEHAFKTCPDCEINYTTQDACPHCQKPSQKPLGRDLNVMSISLGVDKPKPKKKRAKRKRKSKPTMPKMTKTTQKLAIPLAKYGELIYYVRYNISHEVAIKKKRDHKIRAYWLDGEWHSELELWFWCAWKKTGRTMPACEYHFHPQKKYRFDFAFPKLMIAIEMEGGVYSRGRHTRGQGYKADLEKYNEATRLGWKLYRFADMKQDHIEYMKSRISEQTRKAIA
jgi:hypothetical protein